MYFAAVYRLHW